MSFTLKLTVARIEDVSPFSGIKLEVSLGIDDRKKLLKELEDQHLLAEPFGDDDEDMVDSSDLDETISKIVVMHPMHDILQELHSSRGDEFIEWVNLHMPKEE